MVTERLDPDEFAVLGDVLRTMRMRGTIFFRSELAAPWGFEFARDDDPRFHISVHGHCAVGTRDADRVLELSEMEIALVPGGEAHWIADRPGRDLLSSEHATDACRLYDHRASPTTATNRLMCGRVQFDPGADHPLLSALPSVLHLRELPQESRVWRTVELLDEVMTSWAPGMDDLVVDRLSEVLFVEMLKSHVREDEVHGGFFVALADRRLNQALGLLHGDPKRAWTVNELASRVNMSRAALTRHFTDKVGSSPIEYLANWRLSRAYEAVRHTSAPLEQIAERVGFGSAQTLTKAFRRKYGATPFALRREPEV